MRSAAAAAALHQRSKEGCCTPSPRGAAEYLNDKDIKKDWTMNQPFLISAKHSGRTTIIQRCSPRRDKDINPKGLLNKI